MAHDGRGDARPLDSGAYALLQQKLAAMRARLDRQVDQLIRLNTISDRLLQEEDVCVEEFFAEAIVDVLDVALGAVWLLPADRDPAHIHFSAFGLTATQGWAEMGEQIAAQVRRTNRAAPMAQEFAALLPNTKLVDPIVCVRTAGPDDPTTILLASRIVVGSSGPAVRTHTMGSTSLVLGSRAANSCAMGAARLVLRTWAAICSPISAQPCVAVRPKALK